MDESNDNPRDALQDARRYLVRTNEGDVVVVVNSDAGGLDDDLFTYETPSEANVVGLTMTIPLTAFSSKVVDIIEMQGTAAFGGSDKLREMLVREKATSELRRLERYAKESAAAREERGEGTDPAS